MRVLVASDLRGAVSRLDQLAEVIQNEDIRAMVFCGNIIPDDARTKAFEEARANGKHPEMDEEALHKLEDIAVKAFEDFFDRVGQYGIPVFVVPGYLDAPERLFLQAGLNHEVVLPQVDVVHRAFSVMPGENLAFAGFGGGLTSDPNFRENRFVLVYPDWEAQFAFDLLRQVEIKQNLALIFHTPPRWQNLDLENGNHVGHTMVNHLIKSLDPKYAFVGSARDGQGAARLATTLVINPGWLKDGHYAILDTKHDEVRFERLPEPVAQE